MPIAYTAPGLEASDVSNLIRTRIQVKQYLDEQKANAIRWQGTQDYETLVRSGVKPQDALARVAPKLFYNDPRALAASVGNVAATPGQISTDPRTGKQFITQPNGRITPVPSSWMGSRTVVGPDGQVYKVPLDYQQWQTAPQVNQPQIPKIYPLPAGTGYMMVNPRTGSGTRIPPAKTEMVRIPADPEAGIPEMYLSRAENAKREAMMKAKPLLDEYNQNLQNIAAGEVQWGPDNFWPFSTPYKNQNARLKEELRQIGVDTNGTVLAGSQLAQDMGLDSGLNPPPVSDQSTGAPVVLQPGSQVQMVPPGQAVAPTLIPRPRRMPPRFYMGPNVPLKGDRYQEFRRSAPPPAGGATPQPPPTSQQLGTARSGWSDISNLVNPGAGWGAISELVNTGAVSNPPPAISPTDQVRTNQALGVPASQQGVRFGVHLGPDEVLKKYRGKLVVFNTRLKRVVRSAE